MESRWRDSAVSRWRSVSSRQPISPRCTSVGRSGEYARAYIGKFRFTPEMTNPSRICEELSLTTERILKQE
jgi:hypothetical protein